MRGAEIYSERGLKHQENKLRIIEDDYGGVMGSIGTYNHDTKRYEYSGVVELKPGHKGGNKIGILTALKGVIDSVKKYKKNAPLSRLDFWDREVG